MWPNYSACACFQQVTENAPKCLRGPFRDLNRKSEYPPLPPGTDKGSGLCSTNRTLTDHRAALIRSIGPHGSANLQQLRLKG